MISLPSFLVFAIVLLKNIDIKITVKLIFLFLILASGHILRADHPRDLVFSFIKKADTGQLSDILADKVNLNTFIPDKISGIFSKNEVVNIFRDIFSSYNTESLALIMDNMDEDSYFLAYEWTLKRNGAIIKLKLLLTLEKRNDQYFIIKITCVEK